MITTEQKLKKKVQIIVAACLSVFFVLVTVVVFQFAIRINQNNQVKAMTQQSEYLKQQIKQAEQDTIYFSSEQFKKDFELRYLNKGKPGDKISG